jgi:hypothetical protein
MIGRFVLADRQEPWLAKEHLIRNLGQLIRFLRGSGNFRLPGTHYMDKLISCLNPGLLVGDAKKGAGTFPSLIPLFKGAECYSASGRAD